MTVENAQKILDILDDIDEQLGSLEDFYYTGFLLDGLMISTAVTAVQRATKLIRDRMEAIVS